MGRQNCLTGARKVISTPEPLRRGLCITFSMLLLSGCEKHQTSDASTKLDPPQISSEKSGVKIFPLQDYDFGKGRYLQLSVILSHKADGQVYFKVEASSMDPLITRILQGRDKARHLYLSLQDANGLILREVAPPGTL